MPSFVFHSNLDKRAPFLRMKHLHPKTRKYLMLGFFPVIISSGVLFKILWRQRQLVSWQAVLMASAQKLYGLLNSAIMVLIASMRVRFFLSTTPFCLGV